MNGIVAAPFFLPEDLLRLGDHLPLFRR